MALIKSISGIRGTIGGKPGEGLTPVDVVKFSAAYGTWIKQRTEGKPVVVVGRDARKSGEEVASMVKLTLLRSGIDVIYLDYATTPTVELAVTGTNSSGGIIITASHNPAQWNALKLLNDRGEFLSAADGAEVLKIAESDDYCFASLGEEGICSDDNTWNSKHIEQVLALDLVDKQAIEKAGFKVAVDCINSVGSLVLPDLLSALGVKTVVGLNMTANGCFNHNPEPLPQNLQDIFDFVVKEKADVGFVVDPDVDRLAIVSEDGSFFGEEYTLVSVSDYVLSHTPGITVSNMSSTIALKDITEKHGCRYFSAPVGEINVVNEMKARGAVIGGEGNGGVIYPALHYGRDALVGIALFLTLLAKSGKKCSELRKDYPDYVISKRKLTLETGMDFGRIKEEVKKHNAKFPVDERDGLKIMYPEGWIQIRKSNTEPVMRIYAEGKTEELANEYSQNIISIVKNI